MGLMDGKLVHCFAASQGGTKQQDQQEQQQQGPKGPMPIFGPQILGQFWPQEAPKWGPSASQEEPCGVHKRYKNQCFLNDSWFGSKSRWHQARRPTRRATRGPLNAPARSVPPKKKGKKPPSGPHVAPKLGPWGCKKGYKTQWIFKIFGFEASQGGTRQQDQDEEQQESPKRPMTTLGLRICGRL